MKRDRAYRLWLTTRFFRIGAVAIALCALGFAFPAAFVVGQATSFLLFCAAVVDGYMLFRPSTVVTGRRLLPSALNLNEDTEIVLEFTFPNHRPLYMEVVDELPDPLQERDFTLKGISGPQRRFRYTIRPIGRGVYSFGDVLVFLESPLRLLRRRIRLPMATDVRVYPNIAEMRRAELRALSRMSVMHGSKIMNRIGRSYEFEQISSFAEGDDIRSINWRATGKTRSLMANRYRDERSQNLYCIISKGRSMKMAFRHLTYLDYSINATLALSNLALKHGDKAGLITFSNKIGSALRAESRPGHIRKILDALYAENERREEPDYALLHRSVTRLAPNRSLILFFTNFDSMQMVDAALPVLHRLSKKHMLIAVVFQDPELTVQDETENRSVTDMYRSTLIRQHVQAEKERVLKLRRRGIHTLVCRPQELTTEVINRYMEIKAMGLV